MKRILTLLALAAHLEASGPLSWELSQFSDFARGRFQGISIGREGTLRPGPNPRERATIAESSLWSAVLDRDETIFVGTGPRGRIYRVARGTNTPSLHAQLPGGHIFALAIDAKGDLFAGLSPNGQIYRIEAGRPVLYAETGAKAIWALLFAPDGSLFVGTGDDGRILRVRGGQTEVWFESGQSNITSLAWVNGALWAGSDPNGILYRIPGKGTGQVLYDAPFTEIRAIQSGANGDVYFLAMGGAAKKAQAAAQPAAGAAQTGIPQVTTTITVTEEAQAGLELKPKPANTTAPATTVAAQPTAVVSSSLDVPGLDRSAIYRYRSVENIEQVYVTKEESLYDLIFRKGSLYFLAEARGRVFRLDAERQPSLLAELGESEMTRLLSSSSGLLSLSTTAGRLTELPDTLAPAGKLESPVHEAPNYSRWGALHWVGTPGIKLETRSGNSSRPDSTWSDWQAVAQEKIQSPGGKFLQWRMQTSGPFVIHSIAAHYLPQNQPPQIKTVSGTLGFTAAPQPKAVAGTTSTGSAYTLTVTDTGEATSSSSAGTAALVPTRPGLRQLILVWTADDPDGDVLQYSVFYRGEDEEGWRLLKENLSETSYAIDTDTLSDGRYYFRVVVTDRPSNSSATAKSAEMSSAPVTLDQTPPSLSVSVAGNLLSAQAQDTQSLIRRIDFSIDGGTWMILDCEDGVFDSRVESARAEIPQLPAGNHTITVRAWDASLNVVLRKVTLQR